MRPENLFKTLPTVLIVFLIVACGQQGPAAQESLELETGGETATLAAEDSPTATALPPATVNPSSTATTAVVEVTAEATSTPLPDLAPTVTVVSLLPTSTTGAGQAEIDPTATFTPRPPQNPTVMPTWTPTATPAGAAAACADGWLMPDPPEVCPDGPPLVSYAAAQRFERGWMIWVEESDTFYILFNLGAHPFDSRLAFRTLGPLVLRPGASVDNRVGETPPAGLSEPVSGFGLIWRGEVEGMDVDLRQALGWAVVPESGFQTAVQCERQQTYSARTCYLQHIDGSVIVLAYHAIVGDVWMRR